MPFPRSTRNRNDIEDPATRAANGMCREGGVTNILNPSERICWTGLPIRKGPTATSSADSWKTADPNPNGRVLIWPMNGQGPAKLR